MAQMESKMAGIRRKLVGRQARVFYWQNEEVVLSEGIILDDEPNQVTLEKNRVILWSKVILVELV